MGGGADRLVRIEETGGAFARLRLMKAEDPLRPRARGGQGGLEKTLEVDREIVALRAEIAPALTQVGERVAADKDQAIHERVVGEERRPARFDGPCKSRS